MFDLNRRRGNFTQRIELRENAALKLQFARSLATFGNPAETLRIKYEREREGGERAYLHDPPEPNDSGAGSIVFHRRRPKVSRQAIRSLERTIFSIAATLLKFSRKFFVHKRSVRCGR